ncbi:unnamed protein product [Acanthoscelides obtectus]|uniref:Uncharacterized protein n=1 Tax=Acanthoscelides obtectus TaxID=200917 RepID=A0A9P0JM63_ACAOB|nr:unnamed protein product [Acanthoscelides obtectus]CAK1657959.1 hypothetical protein AOBTE_LOCUS20622 [Acanthoscelides obtectus]
MWEFVHSASLTGVLQSLHRPFRILTGYSFYQINKHVILK